MLFHSYEFIFLFLPVVLIGFHLAARLGGRAQIAWLIGASLVYYASWRVADLSVLIGLMLATYGMGSVLERHRSRWLLALGILINLGALAVFKYLGFFSSVFSGATGIAATIAPLALPLGISFFVFQKIAYLVDTYRGRTIPHGFLDYALFVSFFPQLIAGPIVHQSEMLRQFRNRPAAGLLSSDLAVGLTLFSFGLFKKIVLADGLAEIANPGFTAAATGVIQGDVAWTSLLAYTLQLYFDFSAYTDMAIGLGAMFGIRLPINFNSPYKSRSIIEFWGRWHITLSRFLRDYLYIPLGGSRRGHPRRYLNLLVTMLLGGLWHGASFNFVVWGAVHGSYLCINHTWRRFGAPQLKLPSPVAWLITFLAVMLAWAPFRADTLATSSRLLRAMIDFKSMQWPPLTTLLLLAAGLAIVTLLPNTQQIVARARPALGAIKLPRGITAGLIWRPTLAWSLASGALLAWALVASWSQSNPPPFLYFNF